MSRADNSQAFSRAEHNLRITENKIHLKYFHFSYFHKWKIIKTLMNKHQYASIKLTFHGHFFFSFFFSVKHKLCSVLEKACELSALLILIFARFEFDSYLL